MGFVYVHVGLSLLFYFIYIFIYFFSGHQGTSVVVVGGSQLEMGPKRAFRQVKEQITIILKKKSSWVNPGEDKSLLSVEALTLRSKQNERGDCTPGWHCLITPSPQPHTIFALAPCPFSPSHTSHTVWHLNPANGIISPRGQFSRMENSISLSLLHQIAVELCWHQHCLLTPYWLSVLLLASVSP